MRAEPVRFGNEPSRLRDPRANCRRPFRGRRTSGGVGFGEVGGLERSPVRIVGERLVRPPGAEELELGPGRTDELETDGQPL